MEHKGLVSRVEEDLEQTIALGRSGRGSLPSEREMARRYGVSRTTIRGALQGLAARGLIVRHPGRKSRTVGLDQALTLESLKLALPEEGRANADRRWLLEGFFSLKREVTVELLTACCELADEEGLEQLEAACFALREEVHWREDRRGWARLEFDLLRLAARFADRPGHLLLIQSLEKAFQGLANRVLPHLDAAEIEQWALFAFNALVGRDAQALRKELPALLKAMDAAVLDHLAPASETPARPTPSPAPECPPPSEEEPLSGADRPNRYACHTSSQPARPTEGPPSFEAPVSSASALGRSHLGDSAADPASIAWQASSPSFEGIRAAPQAVSKGAASSHEEVSADAPPLIPERALTKG